MKNILVLAYAISPTRGSEYSVAWNYVKYMSQNNKLTVICGASGEHIGDLEEIESYAANNDIKNVKFVFVKSNKFIDALNSLNRRGIFVYSFYIAYSFWQKLAFKAAKDAIETEQFDLIHYVGPIGYREPGYLWKFDLPYMWGPIGGMTNISPTLARLLPMSGKIKLGIRAFVNSLQLRFNYRVRKAMHRSDLLLTATTENQQLAKEYFNVDASYNPENAIDVAYPLNESKFDDNKKLELVFIGSIDSRKSVITLLTALSICEHKDSIILHVVGDGPLASTMKQYCVDNKIDSIVKWHGNVDRQDVFDIIKNAHLHIITSVSEGNPTTIWETMSKGVPTLSLKHCGMKDTICDKCGFLIDINSYEQIICDIAQTIDECVVDRNILREKADGVLVCREKYLWSNRVAFLEDCYEKAIDNYNSRKNQR